MLDFTYRLELVEGCFGPTAQCCVLVQRLYIDERLVIESCIAEMDPAFNAPCKTYHALRDATGQEGQVNSVIYDMDVHGDIFKAWRDSGATRRPMEWNGHSGSSQEAYDVINELMFHGPRWLAKNDFAGTINHVIEKPTMNLGALKTTTPNYCIGDSRYKESSISE
jgi:hypothetical protein